MVTVSLKKYVQLLLLQEMDKGNRGYIKIEQMAELYRIYKVITTINVGR
jgi:hypothetical protein